MNLIEQNTFKEEIKSWENLNSWEEFEPTLKEIKSKYGITIHNEINFTENKRIWYRGQPDEAMHLDTTLERYGLQEITIEKYLDITLNCLKKIETQYKKKYNLLDRDSLLEEINSKSNFDSMNLLPVYPYWADLRHFGFPSPLLDWTSDPLIASFFAFSNKNTAQKCSIYIYIIANVNSYTNIEPRMNVFGHDVKGVHRRHKVQKSSYTIALKEFCSKTDTPNYSQNVFCSHEDFIKPSVGNNDLIIKINLPTEERSKVLKILSDKGINHFYLMKSKESFMKTIAFEEIDSRYGSLI
jgi:hypothetical protein